MFLYSGQQLPELVSRSLRLLLNISVFLRTMYSGGWSVRRVVLNTMARGADDRFPVPMYCCLVLHSLDGGVCYIRCKQVKVHN